MTENTILDIDEVIDEPQTITVELPTEDVPVTVTEEADSTNEDLVLDEEAVRIFDAAYARELVEKSSDRFLVDVLTVIHEEATSGELEVTIPRLMMGKTRTVRNRVRQILKSKFFKVKSSEEPSKVTISWAPPASASGEED